MKEDNEALDRALDAAEAKQADAAPVELEAPAPDSPDKALATTEGEAQDASEEPSAKSVLRDKSGKFTKPQGATSAEEQTPQISDQDVAKSEQGEAVTEDLATSEAPPIELPAFWSADEKEAVAKAPREVQELIARKEAQRTEWANRIATESERGRGIEKRAGEVFEPHQARLRSQGIRDPFEAVDRLLGWEERLNTDFEATIVDMLRRNGRTPYDLQAYVEGGGQQFQSQEAQPAEPKESPEQIVERMLAERELKSELESFKDGTDSLGQSRRAFVQVYEPQISQAITAIRTHNPQLSRTEALNHAYEFVLSEVRKIHGFNGTAPVKVPAPKAPQAADPKKAKSASATVSGAPSSGVATPRPRAKNIDEALDRAAEQLT